MIGQHSVTVYPDAGSGGWSTQTITNPSFLSGWQGWAPFPFDTTWDTAGIITPGAVTSNTPNGNADMAQSETGAVPVQPASTYRLTAHFRVSAPAGVFFGFHLGDSPLHAYQGPFWAGTTHASAVWGVQQVQAGEWWLTMTADVSTRPPGFDFLATALRFGAIGGGAGYANVITVYDVRVEYLAGQGIDLSCWVNELSIRHGRADTTDQPEASSATLDLDLTDTQLPAAVDVGSVVLITTSLDDTESYTRFYGRITDVNVGWDDAGEDTPNAGVAQVMCVATLADLGRRIVGDAPFPQELDGARVSRVLSLAGVTLDPATSDPGTVQIVARDIDATDSLSVAQEAANSALGLVWQTRAGEVRYADSKHRHNIPSKITLDVCQILVTPTWSRTLQGLVNKVSLGYGAPPAGGGDQPRAYNSNDASVARYGTYGYSLTTTLAALADAQAMASLLVARNATPVWIMSNLPVAVEELDRATTGVLLGLEVNDLLTLTGMPVVVPGTPSTAALWVEGWTERLAYGVHEVELTVSGYCRTAPPTTWDDVNPAWTWDTMGQQSWDDAACFGPPTVTGRWADVPASLRWDAVPNTVTWDTWNNYHPGGL